MLAVLNKKKSTNHWEQQNKKCIVHMKTLYYTMYQTDVLTEKNTTANRLI